MKQDILNKKTIHVNEITKNVLLYIFYAAAAFFIPFCFFVEIGDLLTAALSLAVCVFSILALILAAGSVHGLIGYAIILALFIFLGGALLPAAILSALIGVSCIFSYLSLSKHSLILWGLPLIPAIGSLILTQSAIGSLLALIPFICSLSLSYSVKKRLPRIGAVCRISAALCAMLVVVFAAFVFFSRGELSVSAVKETIESAKTALSDMLKAAATQVTDALGSQVSSVDMDSLINSMISSIFNLLPAIIITLCNVISYVVHSVFLSVHYSAAEDKKEALHMLSFDMSLTSAIVYVVSLLLSFVLTGNSSAIYGAAAENLMVILTPGLVLIAFGAIKALTERKGPSCFGTIIYFLLIFSVASLNPMVIIFVSIAGAIFVILSHIGRKRKNSSDN